jgi:replicative DNA helicase
MIQDTKIERTVLGFVLQSNEIPNNLRSIDFSQNQNTQIFDICSQLIEKKIPLETDIITSYFAEQEREVVAKYINESKIEIIKENIPGYVFHLNNVTTRRYLQNISSKISTKIVDPSTDVDRLRVEIDDELLNIPTIGKHSHEIISPDMYVQWRKKVIAERMNHGTAFLGTGLVEVDNDLSDGCTPGIYSVIAGESSHGKTVVASEIARHIASRPDRDEEVLYFSPESGADKISDRYDCDLTGIPIKDIRDLMLWKKDDKRFGLLLNAAKEQAKWRLHRFDTRGLYLLNIFEIIREYKTRFPNLKVVFIDTLQDLADNINWESDRNQTAEQERMMWRLEIQVKELNVHVCLIAHHHKIKLDKDKKYRPDLEFLKGSGSLGQKASWVLDVHRPFVQEGGEIDNEIDVWLVKNRDGARMNYYKYQFNGPRFCLGNFIEKGN